MTIKKGIARLLQIAGERRFLLALSGVLASLGALFALVPYVSVYFILRELLLHAEDPTSADSAFMLGWAAFALGGMLLGIACSYGGGMASHIAAFRILYGLRVKLAEHIGKLPLGFLNRQSTGAVKKTLEHNVEKVETFVAHQLPDFVQTIVTLVVMITIMFVLHPGLALASLVPIVLAFGVQTVMMRKNGTRESVRAYHDALERMNGSAVQYVRGMPAVKVYGQTIHSFRRFYADMIAYRDFCLHYTNQYQHGYLLFKVLLGSFAAFILPAGLFILNGQTDQLAFGTVFLFFLVMAPGIASPMRNLLFLASTLHDIGEGVDRIDRIFSEAVIPEALQQQSPQRFDITFDHVSFAYEQEDGKKHQALTNLSFQARQGQVTALVGPSGSGKSTAASLVPRFWDVTEGAVRIGGIDIRQIESRQLMDMVSFVFQETFLFYDTVYNNIVVGRSGATQEEVYAAAQAAQCHSFILDLPDGYDTRIGEGGVYLSGGEEQRIAVARAILKDAPVLVLDEATAFADPENEHEMQLALQQLMQKKTVLVIAHRLSSIRAADQIIVLDNGQICETGQHDQLLEANSLYASMWAAYMDSGDWRMNAKQADLQWRRDNAYDSDAE